MNDQSIAQKLKEFLVNDLLVEIPLAEINTEMGLASDMNVDSLGFTEIMAYLEDQFQIRISDKDFIPQNFRNLNAIISLVNSKLSNANL